MVRRDVERVLGRQFWIGGSTDASYAHSYVTCDATGRNLDLSGGKAANQADVQFHSNGYDGQWDNRAHQWDFDEVRFAGSIEMPEEYKVGRDPVRCSDPAATCRPYDAFRNGADALHLPVHDHRLAQERRGGRRAGRRRLHAQRLGPGRPRRQARHRPRHPGVPLHRPAP